MRTSWAAFIAFFLMPFLSVAASNTSDYLNLNGKSDWDQLFKLCENNWAKYESELVRLRKVLKREIDSISDSVYRSRYKKGDAKIRFVRVHWPSDFSVKDPGWEMYRDCAEMNWEVRKLLNSSSSDAKAKKDKIDAFESCLQRTFYERGKKVEHPFDRLIACYRKH